MKKIAILVMLAVAGCTPSKKETVSEPTAAAADTAPEATQILEPAEFKNKLNEPNVVVLDVRTPEEVSQGIIAGAQTIDFNAPDFSEKIGALDKDKTYLLYCKAGGRSTKAMDQMNALGFTSVYNLKGGITAWKEQGLETTAP